VTDHQVTVQLFEWEIGSGYDPQLRAFGDPAPDDRTVVIVLRSKLVNACGAFLGSARASPVNVQF
jgi:hypothetical protein